MQFGPPRRSVIVTETPPAAVPAVATHPTRKRRHWPRRVLLGLNVFVALCLAAAVTLYFYVDWRFGQINRISIPGLTLGGSSHGSGSESGPAGPPMNILLVGSDTRAALSDAKQFGGASVGGARSDTMMIIHLDPAAQSASLLSIPRDLYVAIPGHGKNRINVAFDSGPDLLVRTIQQDLGIAINHYVDVDFDTFRQIVNSVGGLKFWYPEPVRDNDNGVNDSGLNITTPGCYTLDGNMALSLVRTRHLQYQNQSSGRWEFEGQSDLARIRRQQLFIKKMISKVESLGITNLASINGVVGGVVKNLTIDSGLSQSQMLALARRYKTFNPANLPTATLPTTATTIGGADVLLLDQSQATTVIDAWQGITPASTGQPALAAPTTVTSSGASGFNVGVLNGTGRSHQATEATNALRQAGFSASVSGTGAAPSFGYATSTIEYAPGDEASAAALQADVVGGAQLQTDSALTPGHLLFITGSSYGGVQQGVNPVTAPAAPSTTIAGNPNATAGVLATAPGNTSNAPAFPGPHGQDPPPPGSGC